MDKISNFIFIMENLDISLYSNNDSNNHANSDVVLDNSQIKNENISISNNHTSSNIVLEDNKNISYTYLYACTDNCNDCIDKYCFEF